MLWAKVAAEVAGLWQEQACSSKDLCLHRFSSLGDRTKGSWRAQALNCVSSLAEGIRSILGCVLVLA